MGQTSESARAAHLSCFVVGAELAVAGTVRTDAVAAAAGTQRQTQQQGAGEHLGAAFGCAGMGAPGSAARAMGRKRRFRGVHGVYPKCGSGNEPNQPRWADGCHRPGSLAATDDGVLAYRDDLVRCVNAMCVKLQLCDFVYLSWVTHINFGWSGSASVVGEVPFFKVLGEVFPAHSTSLGCFAQPASDGMWRCLSCVRMLYI